MREVELTVRRQASRVELEVDGWTVSMDRASAQRLAAELAKVVRDE